MGIIPKVRNTKKKKKCTTVSRKQFGVNGVGLRVKRRFDVLYLQHLLDSAIKLAITLPQNFEKVFSLCSVFATLCFKVFTNHIEIAIQRIEC